MTQQTPQAASRLQRILSYIIATLVIISLVCIAAVLIGSALGGMPAQGSGQGIWPVVFLLPLVGLSVAFILVITLIIVVGRQRSKAAKAAGSPGPRGTGQGKR